MRTPSTRRPVMVPALVLLLAAGCGRGEVAPAHAQDRAREQVREQLGNGALRLDTTTAAGLSGTFRAAAEQALPAVAFIQVETRRTAGRRSILPIPDIPEHRGLDSPPQIGSGSGFIFDPRGYVLTNNHVIRGAERIAVTLVDGREYPARVIGSDPNTDVAVIKIEPGEGEQLPIAAFGNSDVLRVGDWVLALGNPLGLSFTVTAGIVSAKGRSIGILGDGGQNQAPLEAFIQTDAAINPGNSGGPLVDLLGRVIGINTAIQSATGLNAGYGFAIPINLAAKVADDLIRHGAVQRPRLGVIIDDVSAADAEVYGLASITGAEISSVQANTPASQAGLQMGDVILAVDGQEVNGASELQSLLARRQPGERVRLRVVRQRRELDVTVQLGQFEAQQQARAEATELPEPAGASLLGFQVAPLTAQVANRHGLETRRGVIVTEVSPFSPARNAIREGVIIRTVNGQRVETPQDLNRVGAGLRPGQTVSVVFFDPQIDGDRIYNYRVR
jgi:serine protease Do